MDAKQCRAEQVTIDELDAAIDPDNFAHTHTLMAVTSAKALWEIAAQLSEIRTYLQVIQMRALGDIAAQIEELKDVGNCCARFKKTHTEHDLSCPTQR